MNNNNIPNELLNIFANYGRDQSGPNYSVSNNNIYTPQYVIQADGFFNSTIEGFNNAAVCDIYAVNSKRYTNGFLTNSLMGDGAISSSDAFVQMRTGSWGPKLDGAMKSGQLIPEIKVIRLSSVVSTLQPIIEYSHLLCTIQVLNIINDYLNLYFKFTKIQTTYTEYDQQGNKGGQTVNIFDYTKVTPS